MAVKKEFKIKYYKNSADSQCGTAYLINPVTGKDHTITFVAAPDRTQRTARPLIMEELEKRANAYILDNPGAERVDYEKYEEFVEKHSRGRYRICKENQIYKNFSI